MIFNIPCRSNPMPYYTNALDYSKMPLTFKSTGTTTITFNKEGISTWPVSGSTDGSTWTSVATTSSWNMTDGQYLYLTGDCQEAYNSDISHAMKIKSSGNGTLELYGNIMSLANWRTNFVASSQFGQLFNGNTRLVDASKLVLPVMTLSGNCYRSMFYGCSNLQYGPLLPATALVNTSNATGYDYMFYSDNKLLFVEVGLTSWGSYKPGNFMYGVSNSSGYFIKPQSLTLTRGSNAIPNSFKVLNRINGKLYYAASADSHYTGDEYTGDDPYAWYYN